MKRINILAGSGMMLLATGCTPAQQAGLTKVEPALAAACQTAVELTPLAGLVPGVGAIVPYVSVGCSTAEGLAKLASDPSSVEWVGQQIGKIKALASVARLKI